MIVSKLNIKQAIGLIHKTLTIAKVHQRTASSKNRFEIRGGGKKPWKQKGTGNARAGSIRSSIWVGGNKAFGPKPRVVKKKINAKEKELAIFYSLFLKKNKFLILFKESLSTNNLLTDLLEGDKIKNGIIIDFKKEDFNSFFIILVVTEDEFIAINKKIKPKNIKVIIITKLNVYCVLKSKFIFLSYNANCILKRKEHERLKNKCFTLDV